MILKRQIIVISLIFGILVLFLICFSIIPFLKAIRDSSLELISAKEKLLIFQKRTEEIDKFKASYDKIRQDLEKIEEIYVNPELPVELIEFLEKTGYDLGLLIKISPDPKGFRLGIDGSFVAFQKFLEKIERGPYLIKIRDLSLKSLASQAEIGKIGASLIIEPYVSN